MAGTGRTARLGVIMPLANEADTIEELLARILGRISPGDSVFCVLDHASKDNTRQLIEAVGERDSRVRLVWAPQNRCIVDAYFAGYRAAMADGCDWILEMDGGLSHLPEEMDRFIEAAAEGYDFVCGSRFMPGGQHDSTATRVFLSWIGTKLAQVLLGSRMSDMTSGYELFTRKAMQAVLETGVESRANFFQTEIRHQMHAFNWKEVPIHYTKRKISVGRSAIRESLRILFKLYRQRKAA